MFGFRANQTTIQNLQNQQEAITPEEDGVYFSQPVGIYTDVMTREELQKHLQTLDTSPEIKPLEPVEVYDTTVRTFIEVPETQVKKAVVKEEFKHPLLRYNLVK